jgi:hypothetical protein
MKALPSGLPEELWEIRDAVVEHFHANTPLPQDIERLHEWLEGDGWGILSESWVEEELVMLTEYLSSFFADSELRDAEGLEPSDKINDEIRVEYARNWMSDKFEAGDDLYNIKSIHSSELKRRDGKSATIYCTYTSFGQGGGEMVWHGAFATRQGFFNHLKGLGYWLIEDIESMDDASILAFWQKDKKRGKRK